LWSRDPPPNALYALNDHINADDGGGDNDDRHVFYKCRDIPKVKAIAFSRPNP